MFYYNLSLFFSVIFTVHLNTYVSALEAESILNGAVARQRDFKYQAAILGKPDLRSIYVIICSAVVVAASWILSIAECFLLNSHELRNLIFAAAVGTDNLIRPNNFLVNLDFIYTENYLAPYAINPLVMIKTMNAMSLGGSVLDIPITNSAIQFFMDISGTVSGYGNANEERDDSDSDEEDEESYYIHHLRNVTVMIQPAAVCSNRFMSDPARKFCGIAFRRQERNTGLCRDDIGSPLVINDELVGMSIETNEDCKDNVAGSLYTTVADYTNFIKNVKSGNPLPIWLKKTLNARHRG